SETPAGPPSQADTGGQARPPLARTAGAPAKRPNFGAEWAGSDHRLSTLRPCSRLPGRKTRFRLLARLHPVGSMVHWAPPKGFFDASYIAFLLSQASPGASALRSVRRGRASARRQGSHRRGGPCPSWFRSAWVRPSAFLL